MTNRDDFEFGLGNYDLRGGGVACVDFIRDTFPDGTAVPYPLRGFQKAFGPNDGWVLTGWTRDGLKLASGGRSDYDLMPPEPKYLWYNIYRKHDRSGVYLGNPYDDEGMAQRVGAARHTDTYLTTVRVPVSALDAPTPASTTVAWVNTYEAGDGRLVVRHDGVHRSEEAANRAANNDRVGCHPVTLYRGFPKGENK